MKSIGLFYGSSLDNTKDAGTLLKSELESLANAKIDMYDVGKTKLAATQSYDVLIFGCSTWNIGELQDDWDRIFTQLDTLDFSGKQVALFGCGDQGGYPDTFQDALGIIGRKARERGATLIGFTSTLGYDFIDSLGLEDGQFMGLALDNDNEPKQTSPRVRQWARQLAEELELVPALARS